MTDPDADHLRRRTDRESDYSELKLAALVGGVWLLFVGMLVWAAVRWP